MRCIEEIHIFRKLTTKNNKGQFSKTRNYMIEQRKLTNLKTKELDELLGSQMAKHYFTTGEQFSMPKEDDYIKLQTTGFFQMPYKDLKRMYNSEKKKEVIMDNCMGSGSTGVAAIKANRSFIGIEMDTNYYKIAQRRIAEISKWKRSKA